ncbi:MAG TPA: hypothetical protein VFQ19_06220 [Nocardioidaceae bacterium]|nr:hypothetical protein [Nocardioidaceae bacterium]
MTRYADPELCPDCRGPIQHGAPSCPSCDLSLSGPVAARLFSTLAQADDLLRIMRAIGPAGVPLTPPAPIPPAATIAKPRPYARLSQASVPKVLLALGAVCLLVAALVFLAVTWSVMGVAGRTATLVGFTAVTGGLATWMAHRDLRAAAESLSVVSLGLLGFDLLGARDSGWFGAITTADFGVLLGATLAVAGGAAAVAVRRTPTRDLTGAQVIAALGIASAGAGIFSGDWFAPSAAVTVAVLVAGSATILAHRLRLVVLAVGATAVTGYLWLELAATSFERAVRNATLTELWWELEAWPLVVAAALAGAPALSRALPTPVRVGAAAVAGLVLAVPLLVPFGQDATELTLAVLVLLVAFGALTWFLPTPWAHAGAVSVAAGAAWMSLVAILLSVSALANGAAAGARLWQGTPAGLLPDSYIGPIEPWLLPVAVLAVLGAAVVLARTVPAVDRVLAPVAQPSALLAVLTGAGVATAALYPVPVWLVTALCLLAAAAFAGWTVAGRDTGALTATAAFCSGGVVVGLYDEWLTLASSMVVLGVSAVVAATWTRPEVRFVAGAAVAGAVTAIVWTGGAIVEAERPWTALVALLLLGGLTLALPFATNRRLDPQNLTVRPAKGDGSAGMGVEVGAAVSGAVVALAGLAAATGDAGVAGWLAVYLTVAGAVVTTTSLVRADRRILGWAGGLLLAAASWVRLWDVGVSAPEAYTLPSAVALGLVGLRHLRQHPAASTMTALAPALGLALLPSLVWVLWEPGTVRAALLGAACLALLVIGLRMRWTAPVLLAATVGACVVLRHAAPHIGDALPRWVLIAAAGAVLISMGVTWERRVQEARAFAGYLRALR